LPRAIDLLRQGNYEELWQMCCGFLKLDIQEFMEIQQNLLLQQLESLNSSPIGQKIMRGAKPTTIEEFRQMVPLTSYKDYCPELLEKQEGVLTDKPEMWVHSSGWSGDYTYKWIPLSSAYIQELSKVLAGIGILACARDWGDVSQIPDKQKILYSVAPKPYISGTFADVLRLQTTIEYLPSLEMAEKLSYEERIAAGFNQALTEGLDIFFGLSLVLAKVGEKLRDSSDKINILNYLKRPRALWRLAAAKLRSSLAKREVLPKDIWSLKGIISSGVDSTVYKEKIKELWGKMPLDIYSCTEGGVIATQTWDYEGMTFIPSLNFFEFIPEDELLKWQMDRSYKMKTLLLDEVEAGECYEIVITALHGGSLVRYRIGDMIRITSLSNDKLGIKLPQMAFEHRVDDVIDLYAVRLSEKSIWQAINSTTIPYEDWVVYKNRENRTLDIYLELKNGYKITEPELTKIIYENLVSQNVSNLNGAVAQNKLTDMADFKIDVHLLPKGAFSGYMEKRQREGADLAHLKPPHINPSDSILSVLLNDSEDIIEVSKTGEIDEKEPETVEILPK
jgi:hypothetical protein